MNILLQRFPHLQPFLEGSPPPDSNQRIAAKRQGYTLVIEQGEKPIYLHSQYDPITEAQRWAEAHPPPPGSFIVLLGWGLGYQGIAWLQRHAKAVKRVVVIEPNLPWFLHSLAVQRLEPLRSIDNLDFVLGSDAHLIYQTLLRHMEPLLSSELRVLAMPFASHYPAAALETISQEGKKIIAARDGMLKHMETQGPACQQNIVANLPAVSNALFPRHLTNRGHKQPAIIIGAGPSLDEALPFLQEAQSRAWLFACDTSLPILQHASIQPDLAVTKDPTERNCTHFEQLQWQADSPPLLAFDPQVHPHIPAEWPGPLLCMPNRNHAVHRYIAGLELKPEDPLPLSTNVAVAAFHLAERMGCDPILLVGLDFCFAMGEGRSHASGAALTQPTRYRPGGARLKYGTDETYEMVDAVEVKGNDGETRPATATLYEALRLLEGTIAKTNARVVDTAAQGARKEGAEFLPCQEALALLCDTSLPKPAWEAQANQVASAQETARSIETIADHLQQCAGAAQAALAEVEQDPPDWNRLWQRKERIEAGYQIYHELQSALERLMVETCRHDWLNSQRVDTEPLRQRYQWYFTQIKENAETFAVQYRQAARSLYPD